MGETLFTHINLFTHDSSQTPSMAVTEDPSVNELAGDFMYLGSIQFIREVKAGAPFGESSPMLCDIRYALFICCFRDVVRCYNGVI